MKFTDAIELYVQDQWASGAFRSAKTEQRYRSTLYAHADDVDNRAPHTTGRDDVKRTLRRWSHPNTQGTSRSILVAFYTWTVEEGIRPYNPALQTRRPRRKATSVYRLTRDETVGLLRAAEGELEVRAIYLGVCAGLRSAELRGLQGRHFRRDGFIWVSEDIAKGGRERWVPVIAELQPIITTFAHLADDEFVLPAQRWRDPGVNRERTSLAKRPMSPQALYYLVKRVGERAGIAAAIHPHLMRHAHADHVAKRAGVLVAQAMLGHADIATTQRYLATVTPDELAKAAVGLSVGYPPADTPETPGEATTGIEPVLSAFHDVQRLFPEIDAKVALYEAHFRRLAA